jgi:hypothetical protein
MEPGIAPHRARATQILIMIAKTNICKKVPLRAQENKNKAQVEREKP